ISTVLDTVVWNWPHMSWHTGVRTAVFRAVTHLLSLSGPGLTKAQVHALHPLLSQAADDLLPGSTSYKAPPAPTPAAAGGKKQKGGASNLGANIPKNILSLADALDPLKSTEASSGVFASAMDGELVRAAERVLVVA